MIRIPGSNSDESYFIPFSKIEWQLVEDDDDSNSHIICGFRVLNEWSDKLMSRDGTLFDISDFKAKTLEELAIALDMHDLIYGGTSHSISEETKKIARDNVKLKKENVKLKAKMKKFASILNEQASILNGQEYN